MNFTIHPNGEISRLFLENNCNTFSEASNFIKHLTYKRNANKNNISCVFTDKCGTCSTKHATLKQLAIEQHQPIKLMLGIFKMNKINTPSIDNILLANHLAYLPEAHNYLRTDSAIIDCTKQNWSATNFENDLLEAIEIQPKQITDFKVSYHQQFIKKWLQTQPQIKLTETEIWQIRGQCIQVFGG